MVRVRIEVHLKRGVTDPEGENVSKALKLLGFEGIRGVHTAKLFLIDLEEADSDRARGSAEEMCRRLLANPVIHDSTIGLEPSSGAAAGRRKGR